MATRKVKETDLSVEEQIFKVLNTGRWIYRTTEGISKETHIPAAKVEATLKSHPQVRVSLVRGNDGRVLYASKKKVSGIQDLWTAVRAFSSVKFAK